MVSAKIIPLRSCGNAVAELVIPGGTVPETGNGACCRLTDYLDHMAQLGLSEMTIRSRERFLVRLDAALPVPLDHATAVMLAAWRKGLTLADRTIRGYVSYARVYYAWAIEQGIRIDNPAAKLPVPKIGRLIPRPVSDWDLAHALAAAPAQIRIWLILAAWCGLRAKEIALLKRENILDTACPPVLIIETTATKGRNERIVPMCEFVVGEIRRAGLPAYGWAFGRLDGKPGPNAPWTVSKRTGVYLRSRAVRSTLHQLRHWFGTRTYRVTKDLRLVQELMGHLSPATTAGYAAYDRTEAAAAVNRLPLPSDLPTAAA